MFVKYYLKTILVKISLILICVLVLNGCGGGGSVTSNVASGGPVSIELISSKPWGVNNTGIIKQRDGDTVALYFANDVTEQLKYDGTTSNPNDYEEVSEVDVRVDNNGVVHGEFILRYKVTGEIVNAIISGYADAFILKTISNSNNTAQEVHGVGGPKAQYMPIGNYRYEGYAENTFIDTNGEVTEETGRFTFDADFLNGTGSLLADTGSLSYSDDNIIIDRQDGSFKGTQGTIKVPDGSLGNSTIRGNFHGTSAESITGFHMQKSNPWTSGVRTGGITYTRTLIAGER